MSLKEGQGSGNGSVGSQAPPWEQWGMGRNRMGEVRIEEGMVGLLLQMGNNNGIVWGSRQGLGTVGVVW